MLLVAFAAVGFSGLDCEDVSDPITIVDSAAGDAPDDFGDLRVAMVADVAGLHVPVAPYAVDREQPRRHGAGSVADLSLCRSRGAHAPPADPA